MNVETYKRHVSRSRIRLLLIGVVVWPLMGVFAVLHGLPPGSLMAEYPLVSILALAVVGLIFGWFLPPLLICSLRQRGHRNVLLASTGAAFFTLFLRDMLPSFTFSRIAYGFGTWLVVFACGHALIRVLERGSAQQGCSHQGQR